MKKLYKHINPVCLSNPGWTATFGFDLCSMFTNQSYFFAVASAHHTSVQIQETVCEYWSRPLWWKADPKYLSQQLIARTNCRPRALRWLSLEASFLKRWTTLNWKNRYLHITIPFCRFCPQPQPIKSAGQLKAFPHSQFCCGFDNFKMEMGTCRSKCTGCMSKKL